MMEAKLDEASFSDEETKQCIIRGLAARPDETLESVRTVLSTAAKRRWGVAVQVIRAIGYPHNVSAIPQLVDQVSDVNSPARNESIQALTEMPRSVVVPNLLKTLLDSNQAREYWLDAIAGICSMLATVGREYALECGPAVAYLLSQNIPQHELDPWYLLLVLEKIGPACARYALPVLIDFVKREGNSEVGRQAYSLITSFEKDALEPYHYLLPAL